MAEDMQGLKLQLIDNIKKLIDADNLADAKRLLTQYVSLTANDIEALILRSAVAIKEGALLEAEGILEEAALLGKQNFVVVYNQAYVAELQKKYELAANLYRKLSEAEYSEAEKNLALAAYTKVQTEFLNKKAYHKKRKLAVFVKPGMDSFLGGIIESLKADYEIKKVVVENNQQIDREMVWADLCWFEWCDELIVYASKLKMAKGKKIVCRLHSGEPFVSFPQQVNWVAVDKLICVAEHIKNLVLEQCGKSLPEDKAVVIPNGIDVTSYTYLERKPGYNIAFLGYINYKKGPMLLLHTFKAIYDTNPQFRLHVAGVFQDHRDVLYFNQTIKDMGLADAVYFYGWVDEIDAWLNDKDYILCTSILESQGMGIMQAMSKGIKPLIHNFVGAKTVYDEKYVWTTIGECLSAINSKEYRSTEYRSFVANRYGFDMQIRKIKSALEKL